MKPRKVKEDDAPRTIACPHKVSEMRWLLLRAQSLVFYFEAKKEKCSCKVLVHQLTVGVETCVCAESSLLVKASREESGRVLVFD